MKKKIGLFFGTDTGYTEISATQIAEQLGKFSVDLLEISDVTVDTFKNYDCLILGLSTWYNGELQSDWDDFFEDFKTIDFSDKKVAIFGLGDQYGYSDTFIDGVGIIGEVVLENGGKLIGQWSTDGYNFDESIAVFEKGFFCGLAIDEDNQPDLSEKRIKMWSLQISHEFGLILD